MVNWIVSGNGSEFLQDDLHLVGDFVSSPIHPHWGGETHFGGEYPIRCELTYYIVCW